MTQKHLRLVAVAVLFLFTACQATSPRISSGVRLFSGRGTVRRPIVTLQSKKRKGLTRLSP